MLGKFRKTKDAANSAFNDRTLSLTDRLKNRASALSNTALATANTLTDSTKDRTRTFSSRAQSRVSMLKESVIDGALAITDSVKDKAYLLVEEWLKIFPVLEKYGLSSTKFGVNMSISPTLEVELKGSAEDFTVEKLDVILQEVKDNTPMRTLFRTIRLTHDWHARANSEQEFDKLNLRLVIGISPQVNVSWSIRPKTA